MHFNFAMLRYNHVKTIFNFINEKVQKKIYFVDNQNESKKKHFI